MRIVSKDKDQDLATAIAIHVLESELMEAPLRRADVTFHLIKIVNELRQRIGQDDLDWDYTTRVHIQINQNLGGK